MEKPLLLLLAIPRNTAQFCEYLIAFLCAIITQFHAMKWRKRKQLLRAIPRNEFRLETLESNSGFRYTVGFELGTVGFDTHNPDPQISILTLKLLIRGSISISLINQSFLQLLNAGTTTMRDIE